MAVAIFTARSPNGFVTPWITDGTSAGTRVLDTSALGSDLIFPSGYAPVSPGQVLFSATQSNPQFTNVLVSTDGTATGTAILARFNLGASAKSAPLGAGRAAVLVSEGVSGISLWSTDGTATGTVRLAAIYNSVQLNGPVIVSLGDGRAMFIASDALSFNRYSLWVTDGTATGTSVIHRFAAGSAPNLQLLPIGGGRALFAASDASGGLEPWVTDGTAVGTVLLKDLAPGQAGSQPFGFAPLGDGRFLFSATGPVAAGSPFNSPGLWVTDGTPAGTTLVRRVQAAPSQADYGSLFTPIGGGRLVFAASAPTSPNFDGNELWVTDGTAVGTYQMKDLNPGIGSSDPGSFRAIGAGRFVFTANDGVSGRELWVSDGTKSGTVLLKDLSPGPGSSAIVGLAAVGANQALFELANGASATELWTTDGTVDGTVQLRSLPLQEFYGSDSLSFTPLSPVALPYMPPVTRVTAGVAGDGASPTLFLGEAGMLDVVQTVVGRRGAVFSAGNGGDVQVTRGARVDLLRGIEAMRFIDGRQVFDPNDPAAAVTRLYQAALGRGPDQEGLNYWIAQLGGGASLAAVAAPFLAAPEFSARFGTGLGNRDFVSAIYQNVLGRAPDAGGLGYWAGVLDRGVNSRNAVLASISESAENRVRTAAATSAGIWDASEAAQQVARLYDVALGRLPDAGGLQYWTSQVEAGANSLLTVAATLVTSAEFTATYGALANGAFVGKVYDNTLGRAADANGLAYWTAQLDAGASRAAVALGFSESAEHQARTAAITGGDSPDTFGIKLA